MSEVNKEKSVNVTTVRSRLEKEEEGGEGREREYAANEVSTQGLTRLDERRSVYGGQMKYVQRMKTGEEQRGVVQRDPSRMRVRCQRPTTGGG
jgi:hypothetical protein